METQNTKTVVFLGTTSDVETCDCCGRTNLKKTIALMVNDFPVYYGSECAARALGMTAGKVTREVKKADSAKFAARVEHMSDVARAEYKAGNVERYREIAAEIKRIQCSPCSNPVIREAGF